MPVQPVNYPYRSPYTDTIASLIARQGEIAARGAENSGAIWGRAVENLGSIAGQAIQQHQEAQALKKRELALDEFVQSGIWAKDPQAGFVAAVKILGPVQGPRFFEGLSGATKMANAQSPEDARKALPMVARGLLAAPPGLQPKLYGHAKDLMVTAGLAKPDELPEWGPDVMPYVQAIAREGMTQSKTREVKVRNPDGSESIQIIEDKPGQAFTSAPEPPKPEKSLEQIAAEAEARARGTRRGNPPAAAVAAPAPSSLESLPTEWRTVIDRASLTMPGIRRKEFNAAIGRVAETGDKNELASVVRQAAIEGENVDTKNQVLGRQATIASLKDTGEILKELKAKGVPTGWLTGSMEDLARRLGKTTNPEYVELGNRLMGTLINYRRAATGVAFSARESADYERMFPNYRNELPVNEALIKGLLREMSTYDRAYWEYKLGKKGAELVGALPKADQGSDGGAWTELSGGIKIREKK